MNNRNEDYYKIKKDVYNKIVMYLNAIKVAEGVDNITKYAQMCQFITQVEDIVVDEKQIKEGE